MNWYRVFAFVLLGNISLHLSAQLPLSKSAFIEPYKLEVSFNKTTHLLFPAAILSIDRGSPDILVQKTAGAENILRVKADAKNFEETNLSVVTTDGKLYSFVVCFNPSPAYLNVDLTASKAAPELRTPQGLHQPDLSITRDNALKALAGIPTPYSLADKDGGILFRLDGIYVLGDYFYLRLKCENKTVVSYAIEQLRFYARDKHTARRTASQETVIDPVYILGDTATLRAKETSLLVVAIPKFTLQDKQLFHIAMSERNGGRQLFIKVRNRHLLHARVLPQ